MREKKNVAKSLNELKKKLSNQRKTFDISQSGFAQNFSRACV
jgi:hypothetical protein